MLKFLLNAWSSRAAWCIGGALWFCISTSVSAQSWGPGGNFRFTSAGYTASESDSFVFITVTREGGALGGATVDYTVENDPTATEGVDTVFPRSGTLRFEDFQTRATIFVSILQNTKVWYSLTNVTTTDIGGTNFVITNVVSYLTNNINRPAILTLSNPVADNPVLAPVDLGLPAAAVLNVLDDDAGFNFAFTRYQSGERSGSIGPLRIAVRCPEPRTQNASVDFHVVTAFNDGANSFALQPGSDYAKPNQDYMPVSGTLTFSDDEFVEFFDVEFIDDDFVEFNEDFRIVLNDRSAMGNWRSVVTNYFSTNDMLTGEFIGERTVVTTNNVQLELGAVRATTVTILFDNWHGVATTNGGSRANIATEQPAGAVDLKWNPDNADWTTPPFNPLPGANGPVYAIVVQPDGKSIAAGDFTSMNTEHRNHIARIDTNGWLDFSFEIGTGADAFIQSVALYPTNSPHAGKILIGGGFTSYNAAQHYGIARLNTNGSLDSSFSAGTGANGAVRSVAIQPDGKVIIGGDFTTIDGEPRAGIARLNADGSLDTAFDPGSGADGIVWAVAVVTNGATTRVMIGGDFVTVNGDFRSGIARLNSDGSLDETFDPGTGADGSVYTIAIQADQRILIGGSFTQIDLQPRSNIARLNTNGTLDASFDPGTGANNPVYALHVMSNGRIIVGGAFNSFNDLRRVGVARLFAHGPVDPEFLDFGYNQFAGTIDLSSFVTAASSEPATGNVLIGGSFFRVGGGFARFDQRPRENIARLVGGSTVGPGLVEFMLPQYRVSENARFFSAALMRSNTVVGTLGEHLGELLHTVAYNGSTTDGLATANEDYDPNFQGTFFFRDGWPSLWPEDTPIEPGWMMSDGDTNSLVFGPVLTLPILDDTLQEGDEAFLMHLIPPPFAPLILGGEVIPLGMSLGRRTVPVTIVDNDVSSGVFTFGAPEYVVNENATNVLVSVIRTNGSALPVFVDFSTSDGTNPPIAVAGSDYDTLTRTLSFASGQSNLIVQVRIRDNNPVEEDETFLVRLSNPRGGASLSTASNAIVTIVDDDYLAGRLSFTAPAFTVSEAGLFATISVKRTGGNLGRVTANFATIAGTALAGVDYTPTNGVLVWNDGDATQKTFTVPIVNDVAVEPAETLRLVLTNLTGALPGTHTNIDLTIQEDDSFGEFQFSSASYAGDEIGGSIIVTIVRALGSVGTVSVQLNTQDLTPGPGLATGGADYVPLTTNVTFAPGQITASVAVQVIDDTTFPGEGDEGFQVALSNPTGGATIGMPNMAVVTIIDNETVTGDAGSLDTEFLPTAGTDGFVNSLALQPNGAIVLGGDFRHVNNAVRTRVARLHPDGTLDSAFHPGQGVNGPVRAVALQDDGRVVVGGLFSSVDNTNRNHLARLNSNGSLDISFNPGAGGDNPVNAVAVQTISGFRKIIAGGNFTFFNGVRRPGVVRLNDNGTIDGSFNPGTGARGEVHALAVQPNGKLLVAGAFLVFNDQPRGSIVRLNSDGSLDLTFNPVHVNGEILAVALQLNGRIIIGGDFSEVNSVLANGIARLNSDGTVDGSFDPGSGAAGTVLSLAVQVDGKILVGGDFDSFSGLARGRLTRLNPDGSVDPTINFGAGANNFVGTIALQPDRKILIGGGFTEFDGQERLHVARLHGGALAGAGSLDFSQEAYSISEDGSFATITVRRMGGTAGTVTVDYLTSDISATAGLDYEAVSGDLVFGPGETRQTFVVPILDDPLVETPESLRLTLTNLTGGAQLGRRPAATLTIVSDDSYVQFSSDAYQITEDFFAGHVAISVIRTGTVSGTVLVNYSTMPGSATPNVDYTPVNGRLVFGPNDTIKTFDIPIIDDNLVEGDETVFLTLSGVIGEAELGTPSTAVLTINEDDFFPGDLSFTASAYSVGESSTEVVITVQRTNGLTGSISARYFTSDATARAGMDYIGENDLINFADGQTNQTIVIQILPDSVVEGNETFFVTLTNLSGGAVLRGPSSVPVVIDDDDIAPGSVDRTFNPGLGPNAPVQSVAVQQDRKVIIGGAFTLFNNTNRPYVARLDQDGPLDLGFDPLGGPNAVVSSVAVLPDSRVVIGGSFNSVSGSPFNRVARLHPNGPPDANFNPQPGFNGGVTTLATKQDGRIVVGGAFTLPTRGVAQLRSDGTIDTAFNPGSAANNTVQAVYVQPDGRIIIGGTFTNVANQPRTRVARFNLNGVVDDSFVPSEITNGTVFAIGQQSDGKVIVGGDFMISGSTSRVSVVRLNTDGSIDGSFQADTGPNGIIYDIAVQSTDKIIVVGTFTSIEGVSRNRFGRLMQDGSLDLSFEPGSGANNTVFSVALLPNEDIIIGGDFSLVGGVSRNRVARIIAADRVPVDFTGIIVAFGSSPRMTITTVPGRSYVLERTSDFQNWLPIATNAAAAATLELIDPEPATAAQRFYRARER